MDYINNIMETNDNEKGPEKPGYEAPDFESETIFETRALACGKCRPGPHKQQACMRMPSVS
jgi:hypothetical protein